MSFLSVSGIGQKLKDILSEGIANLLNDLIDDPDLKVPNYLQLLQSNYLNAGEMEYFIDLHLISLLELDSCPSTRDAIAQQRQWDDENSLQQSLCLNMITVHACAKFEQVLGKLLDRMLVPSFVNWKYGLALLKVILQSAPELRSDYKSEFNFKLPLHYVNCMYNFRTSIETIYPVDVQTQ